MDNATAHEMFNIYERRLKVRNIVARWIRSKSLIFASNPSRAPPPAALCSSLFDVHCEHRFLAAQAVPSVLRVLPLWPAKPILHVIENPSSPWTQAFLDQLLQKGTSFHYRV